MKKDKKNLIKVESALSAKECTALHQELGPSWTLIQSNQLKKEFHFSNFLKGLEFVNNIAELAEQIQHHPDLFLSWGKVGVSLTTHSLKGLSKKDFNLAEKIDALYIAKTFHE